MAEPARKLDVDALERQPSKRTMGALGKVVDLDARRKRAKRLQKQQNTAPASAEAERKPAPVINLDAEREKRARTQTPEQNLAPVINLDAEREKRRLNAQKAAEASALKGASGFAPSSAPLQMASALGAAQARDRLAGAPMKETLPAGTDERVFLELDPRSYALREQTAEQKEKRRQAAMMETAKRFTAPEGEAPTEEAPPGPEEAEKKPPGAPSEPVPARIEQTRIAGELQRGRIQEHMAFTQKVESAEHLQRRALAQRKALVKANKSIRRTAKLIQAAGIETILPLITLIIQLNLETINKWIFKIEIPGIILVDRYPKLDATDAVTLLVDMLLIFAALLIFLQTAFFLAIWVIITTGFVDVLSSLLSLFSGLF